MYNPKPRDYDNNKEELSYAFELENYLDEHFPKCWVTNAFITARLMKPNYLLR